jgi:acetolactate synthase-1/2/3 large subunit
MKLAGGEIVCEALIEEGVDLVFGIPGGAILPFYDHILKYPQIKHVLMRHEQGGAHAADGYARATGKVGVCIATSGPGALNLLSGLGTAFMDSTPMVAITGQVPRAAIGKDAFQETDVTGASVPIIKHSYLVMNALDIPRVMKEAFYIARTGRPGPVLVDIPRDVLQEVVEYTGYPKTVNLPGYKPRLEGNMPQIRRAAELINGAKKPVILAGRGVLVARAEAELKELAEKAQVPVICSLLGLGAFPGTHPLSLSLMGMHGSAFANLAVDECDVLINIGSRFDDRILGRVSDFAPKAQIIHVNIDASAINQNIRVHVPVVGDAKAVLEDLLPLVQNARHDDWLKRMEQLKKEHPLVIRNFDQSPSTQYVIKKIYEETQGKSLIVTGVGQHQMWAAQHYLADEPNSFMTSGGLGTMGYEVPAAIGVQMARPDRMVWSICGDAGFQMTLQELAVVRDENLPIKYAIMNNGHHGMVRQWQTLFYGKRYSAIVTTGPDFVKLAEAYGIRGIRVTSKSDVAAAIREANATNGPVLVEFLVEVGEHVYPMIPSGQSVKEMMEDSIPDALIEEARR